MTEIILIRHGQSEWNAKNKFTGWVDSYLSEKGKLEAKHAGELIKNTNIKISISYTSYLRRAQETLNIILNVIGKKENLVEKAWELNERHYGELTGLNKDEMKKKFGEEEIFKLRRSWDYPPGPLSKNNPYHPSNIETYNDIPRDRLPDTESLKDTYNRVVKFYDENIKKNLNKNILIAAHGNSIRALCKYLFNLDNEEISKLEIPTGNPLLIELDSHEVKQARYLDNSRAKDLLKF
jgi:2,3-bisphosphoglycerate-dependent phosphoglycerate mutase